jgi:hypothetical protein
MVDVCVALDLLLPLLSNTIYETGATSDPAYLNLRLVAKKEAESILGWSASWKARVR